MWFGNAGTGSASGAVETLAFAPDSRTLYTAVRGQVLAWDTSSRQREVLVKATDPDTSFWFNLSPCGRFILIRKLHQVIVRRSITGAVVSRDTLPEELRGAQALSPCGRYYTESFTDSNSARRWDWAERREAEPLTLNLPPSNGSRFWFALHANGRAAVGDPSKQELALYDTGTGTELWRTRVPDDNYWRVRFDGSGERVLVEGKDAGLTALCATSGVALWNAKPSGRLDRARLTFHPLSPLFALVSSTSSGAPSGDQPAWFGDLNTGERVLVPDPGFKRANCVAFSPDGLTCAVGSGSNKFCVFDLDL